MEHNHSRSSIPSYNDKFNIMIIGDGNVGKTSILDKFCNGSFKPTFQSSKEIEYYNKEYSYKGNIFLFKLWDTVSHNKFEKISKAFYEKSDYIIIVSSFNNRESYLNISKWVKNIAENIDIGAIPLVILSNKVDLEDERQVGLDEIHQKAEELKFEYYETSALSGYGINEAFNAIFKNVVGGVYKEENKEKEEKEELAIEKEREEGSSQSLNGCIVY